MKALQFSDAQKAFVLKEGDEGVPVGLICRGGTSQATYFRKKKYASMLPPEMKKLKQLQDENARLKKIAADQRAATTAWSKLFAKPLVIAFNT
ncbi:transposase [Rhizobium leguminosarum]|nr:transposase [Rhizobium leguminosarum]MBY5827348.1 transposase [Rhizobium leguminosarum]